MASDRQIEANRLNAQKSTGPRTEEGRERVSRNPLKHGLSAVKHVVLDHEDQEEFVRFREAMIADLDPQTQLEVVLVDRIISLSWRLRRVPEFEVVVFARLRHHQKASLPTSEADEAQWQLQWGGCVTSFLQHDVAHKLNRHDAHLSAQLSRAIKELTILQADRQRRPSDGG